MDLRSIVNSQEETPRRASQGLRRNTLASLLNGTPSNEDESKQLKQGIRPPVQPLDRPETPVQATNADHIAQLQNNSSPLSPTSAPNGRSQVGAASLPKQKIEDVSSKPEHVERFHNANNGKPKPRRYSDPPIWARSWQSDHHIEEPPVRAKAEPQSQSRQSSEPRQFKNDIGPGGYVSLLGLKPSVSGVIPADEITLKICNWIYSHLHNLDKDRQYVEIEFKFGVIGERNTRERIQLPIVSEAVLSNDYVSGKTFFNAELPDNQFIRVEDLIKSLSGKSEGSTLTSLPDQRTRDVIYDTLDQKNGSSHAQRRNIRISYNESDDVVEKIVKSRIGDLFVCLPGDLVDLRISLSTEVPYAGAPEDLPGSDLIRLKNRQSWATNGARFDLTSVRSEGRGQGRTTKEVELELDSKMVVTFFEDFQSKKDPAAMDKLQELVQFGLDSCRVVARNISRQTND